MRSIRNLSCLSVVLCLAPPALAGNGYMGGAGTVVVEEPPPVVEPAPTAEEEGGSGMPSTVDGPLNDKGSDAGALFGDLYKILRYQGSETKSVPEVNAAGEPVLGADGKQHLVAGPNAVGGEPILTADYGYYASEVTDPVNPEIVTYALATSAYPGQCVQPVANFQKWGDISSRSGLESNRIPLIATYDATWGRTECAVGQLVGSPVVDPATGAFVTPTCSASVTTNCLQPYFVPVGGTWNGVTYCYGVLWTDLVEEVAFGRLNLSRAPEAVLQSAFDEAIASINSADTVGIRLDAAGRLLLKKNVYSETLVDACGLPALIGTTEKAIDSPLENLALYVKLMKDGHLVTPGDEREPIDRSEKGGIPLWKLLELTDGPSAALRPTVDIAKLGLVFPNLVDVSPATYYTYYECYTGTGAPTTCLCAGTNPDGTATTVACSNVATRELVTVDACPAVVEVPNAATCEGPWTGIKSDDGGALAGADFGFAAAFLAAAADKTGDIGVDMVVYLNSILGINQVIGYSAYDADGNPTADAVDYSKSPVYFDYQSILAYGRSATLGARGDAGSVTVLQETAPGSRIWAETAVPIVNRVTYNNLGVGANGMPDGSQAAADILGFTQQADDDLSVTEFIHTYQIPALR